MVKQDALRFLAIFREHPLFSLVLSLAFISFILVNQSIFVPFGILLLIVFLTKSMTEKERILTVRGSLILGVLFMFIFTAPNIIIYSFSPIPLLMHAVSQFMPSTIIVSIFSVYKKHALSRRDPTQQVVDIGYRELPTDEGRHIQKTVLTKLVLSTVISFVLMLSTLFLGAMVPMMNDSGTMSETIVVVFALIPISTAIISFFAIIRTWWLYFACSSKDSCKKEYILSYAYWSFKIYFIGAAVFYLLFLYS